MLPSKLAVGIGIVLLSSTPMLAQTSASPFGDSTLSGNSHSASPSAGSASGGIATTTGTVGRTGGSVLSVSPGGSGSTAASGSASTFNNCTGVNSVASPAAELGCQ